MNGSTNHPSPATPASPPDKAARSENEFPPNPPQEVHYEAKPLSYELPTAPTEGWMPASASRSVNRIEVYWIPDPYGGQHLSN